MKLGKLLLFVVVLAVVAVVYFIFTKGNDGIVTATTQESFLDVGAGKRGDDPLYSEEIRKNSALTMEARDKTERLAAQFEQLRREKATSEKRLSDALSKIDQLTQLRSDSDQKHRETLETIQSLQETIKQLQSQAVQANESPKAAEIEQSVKEAYAAQIKQLNDTINQLSDSITQSAEENAAKMQQLEQQLTEQAQQAELNLKQAEVAETTTAPVAPQVSETKADNAITYPYGFTAPMSPNNNQEPTGNSAGGLVENLADKAKQTAQRFINTGESGRLPLPSQSHTNSQSTTQAAVSQTTAQAIPPFSATTTAATEAETEEDIEWETVFPVYTLPPNTILSDSLLVTPIIGRVPLAGGNVTDPFFFKVEVGQENLVANGHQVPGIAKMIASGYATGVREQSCVRGYIDSLTFVFVDGRIVTHGQASSEGTGNEASIGYLADQWGKPCIRGRYINNAKSYLMSRGMAAFVEAAAAGLSQSQLNQTQTADGNYQAVLDGNVWSYILGQGISGSAGELAEYVRERTANAFDVVYVEQAQSVQIFLNQMVPIDYDSEGRKVQYYAEPAQETYYD